MRADWTTHWRRFRLAFRWCRIGLLSLILAAVVVMIYLTTNDVPAFVRTAVTAELRSRGLDVTFESLRFRWYRGFVADGVRYGSSAMNSSQPEVQIGQLAIQLDWEALLRREIEVSSVTLGDGRVQLNLAEPDEPRADLVVDVVLAQIHFLPGGLWELDQLQLQCLNMNLHLAGTVTNVPVMRQWQPRGGTNLAPAVAQQAWRRQARQLVEISRGVRFASPPDFRGTFNGDARDPASFVAEFRVRAAGAKTRWGTLGEFSLLARLNDPPPTNGWFHTTAELTVADARTDWGELAQGFIKAEVANPPESTVPTAVKLTLNAAKARTPIARFARADLRASAQRSTADVRQWLVDFGLTASEIRTEWASSQSNRLKGTGRFALGDWRPEEAALTGEFGRVESRWGSVRNLRLDTATRRQAGAPVRADRGWWTNLTPYTMDLNLKAHDVAARGQLLDSLALDAGWADSKLTVTNLIAELAGGSLRLANTCVDLADRRLEFDLETDIDPGRLSGAFTNLAEGSWRDFAWDKPPRVTLKGRLDLAGLLPPGQIQAADVLKSLSARASFFSGPFQFRSVGFDGLQVEGGWEGGAARVDRLRLARPEGDLELSGGLDLESGAFSAAIHSALDPGAFRPFVMTDGGGPLGLFDFKLPPRIDGAVRGRLGRWDELGVQADFAATNFVFRGDPIDTFSVGLTLTNLFLVATNADLRTGDQWANAPGIGFDIRTSWLYLTNARSRIDPMRVARAINTNVVRAIAPYHFSQPPLAQVNGRVPTAGSVAPADMTFEVEGGPFQFWRFDLPQVKGTVLWRGEQVAVTNLSTAFYGGGLDLNLGVAIQPAGDANFQFQAAFKDAQLGPLVRSLTESTNQVHGLVNGTLNVTYANSADALSWEGSGEVVMREGYLWDFPLFSILSRMLNLVVPGVGNIRASAGRGTFTLQHSVVHTENLHLRAIPLRLLCRGRVDLSGNVSGEIEAEILREMPLLGPLISFALSPVTKVLTFRIGNKLGDPLVEPIMVPSFLRAVLGLSRVPTGGPAAPASPPPTAPPAKPAGE